MAHVIKVKESNLPVRPSHQSNHVITLTYKGKTISEYNADIPCFRLARRKKNQWVSKEKIPRHYSVGSGVSDETIKPKTSIPLTKI